MIILGAEALASGLVTTHELRRHYRRVFPGVHAPKGVQLSLWDRCFAAFLWSGRRGVISGAAAAALHGARWVDADAVIDLNHANIRAPVGIMSRQETLHDNEVVDVNGVLVTSVERTVFDLARFGSVADAVGRLDALARAVEFKADDVIELSACHPGAPGRLWVPEILDLMDAGAQSMQESYWRMRILAGGYARPETQLPVLRADGYSYYYLDMGWRDQAVAAEYDGEQHRTDDQQYASDILRSEFIAQQYQRVRIVKGDHPQAVYRRLEAAGLRPTCEPPAILLRQSGVWAPRGKKCVTRRIRKENIRYSARYDGDPED
ncbi:MAG: hypothetical protein U0R18_14435 [Mycobacterium sp.]